MRKAIEVIDDFSDWNTWYKDGCVDIPEGLDLYPNQGVVLKGDSAKAHGVVQDNKIYRAVEYYPQGIKPKNTEQSIALNMLQDTGIALKILSGAAGSGKTLLASAHALQQLRKGDINKILIAKSMTPVGRSIGHLPGEIKDKTVPWLGGYIDNFLVAGVPNYEVEAMIEDGSLEITPITFIQGRSISNAIIIIDEAQNLDMVTLKQIITRASEGSEIIILGDPTQRFEWGDDNPLKTLINAGIDSNLVAHIDLIKTVRSPIADWAVKNL